jgi:hypothetical protein
MVSPELPPDRIFNALHRKHNRCKLIGHVGVVNAVGRPAPGGLDFAICNVNVLKSPEEEVPDIAIFGREGAAAGKVIHAAPGQREFYGPSLAAYQRIVQAAIDMHRCLQSWEIPVEEGPAWAARVRTPPEMVLAAIEIPREWESGSVDKIKLRNIESAAAAIGIPPDEKDLIYGSQRIDLELIVAVAAIDKEFHVVFAEYDRVAFHQFRFGVGLFNPEPDIQVIIIPQGCCECIVESRQRLKHHCLPE